MVIFILSGKTEKESNLLTVMFSVEYKTVERKIYHTNNICYYKKYIRLVEKAGASTTTENLQLIYYHSLLNKKRQLHLLI